MPNVVIDVERLRNVHCGLGQFSLHLGRALLDEIEAPLTPIMLARPEHRAHLSDREPQFLDASPWRGEPFARWIRPWYGMLPQAQPPALWHATHQDTRFLPLHRSTQLILTIHDLNFLREKSPASIRRRLRRLQPKVTRAAILTTASEHAAGEIREHLETGGKEIAIIPHGVCVRRDEAAAVRPAFLPPGPFLFTIGDITPKKNFHALADLAARLPEFRVVIAGSKATNYAREIERRAIELGLTERVILPGKVSNADRAWLYEHCAAFLFPSRSEGFGMPVIEAMSSGCPVFCAHATSLPEVGGDLAFYWHDLNPDRMAIVVRDGLAAAANDSSFGDKLRARAGQFTWKRSAQAYLALYRRLLGGEAAADEGKTRVGGAVPPVRPAA